MKAERCAYCGGEATTKDHVFPKCLYPASKRGSNVPPLKVPACLGCNQSFADDEAHFRNILVVSGEQPNSARMELWESKIERSWEEKDGRKRATDVFNRMVSVQASGGPRHMVFPGKDERVLRIVRKIIRGLHSHHELESPISEARIWVDVLKYIVPPVLEEQMQFQHRDRDVVEYRFQLLQEEQIISAWILTFFGRVPFIGLVMRPGANESQPRPAEQPN